MRIFHGIDRYESGGETCLTTGTFDGVHVGHRKIISMLNNIAREEGLRSVMFTFHPHPRKVLFPEDHGLQLLTSMDEKLALLEQAGIDDVIIYPFSRDFSRIKSVEYVRDLLVNALNMKHLVIGYDHHFGRNREGDIHQLRELSSVYGFKVTEIPAQDVDDVNVSSTKIRTALLEGDIENANAWLGYKYSFTAMVVDGKKRGRALGFPTANLRVDDDTKLIPRLGVYAVDAVIDNKSHRGMMSIGYNPTFEDEGEKTIEVNLFDFDREIYGETITVRLLKYLRPEHRFSDVDELKSQLEIDKLHSQQL